MPGWNAGNIPSSQERLCSKSNMTAGRFPWPAFQLYFMIPNSFNPELGTFRKKTILDYYGDNIFVKEMAGGEYLITMIDLEWMGRAIRNPETAFFNIGQRRMLAFSEITNLHVFGKIRLTYLLYPDTSKKGYVSEFPGQRKGPIANALCVSEESACLSDWTAVE